MSVVVERGAGPSVERLAEGCVRALRTAGLLQVAAGPQGEYVRLPEGRVGSLEEAQRVVAFSLEFDMRLPSAPAAEVPR